MEAPSLQIERTSTFFLTEFPLLPEQPTCITYWSWTEDSDGVTSPHGRLFDYLALNH